MTTLAEGAVLPPPPQPVKESETVERIPFATKLYDALLLHGPMTEVDLRQEVMVPLGEPWREYVRWNGLDPKKSQKPSDADLRKADIEYFDRAVSHGLQRGWLKRKSGKLEAAEEPPDFTPLKSLGGADRIQQRLLDDDNKRAIALLRRKDNVARRKPTTKARNALHKSLQEIGQVNPIVRWRDSSVGVVDWIIVDGTTRLELLEKDGVEPIFSELPASTPAVQVLGMRIASELNHSTKDEADEARNDYIAAMKAEGFTQDGIAKLLNMSQERVGQILRTLGKARRQMTQDDVDEIVQLSENGWSQRDISEQTGWAKTSVQRALSGPISSQATNGTTSVSQPSSSKSSGASQSSSNGSTQTKTTGGTTSGSSKSRSQLVPCALGCNSALDPNAKGVYQFASGWIENRAAGGANALVLPEKQQQWACAPCIERKKKRRRKP